MNLLAIYRSPTYSPNQHRENDTAILDATVAHLAERGWRVERVAEPEVEAGRIPAADLYVNMCQGPAACERLLALEQAGARLFNRPSAVLACHRHNLVERLAGSGLPFPRTLIVPTDGPAPDVALLGERLWVKRGDVHAERAEDVVAVSPARVAAALRAFAGRGIRRAALQEHVEGPVVKFYATADGTFFRAYGAVVDEARLREAALAAAAVLGLDVFGGDAVVPEPGRPVLIDINDWPSFAAFRSAAALAIAVYIQERAFPQIHEPHSKAQEAPR